MKTTKIEWTDKTWNPITGCTKISAGCANCYAEIMSKRLQAMGVEKYKDNFSTQDTQKTTSLENNIDKVLKQVDIDVKSRLEIESRKTNEKFDREIRERFKGDGL